MSSARPSRSPAPSHPLPPPTDRPARPAPPSPAARVLTAQLRCFLCGTTCGTLEAPAGPSLPAVAQFTPADGSPARVLYWRALRCPRCGRSSLLVDEVETIERRVERVDWGLDEPRRGRPPRWLVALRAARNAA